MIALYEKDYDHALAELQQSNLQNAQNLHRIAEAYQAKGDSAEAQKAFKRVADFNPLNSLNYSFVRVKAQQMMAKAK